MNHFEKFDEYIENLLRAQYDISEIIEHALTRGEIREDFLMDIIQSQFETVKVAKGIISNGTTQSCQCDLVFVKPDARQRKLGRQTLIEVEDTIMVLEVKSNATGTDIKEFNEKAKKIKELSEKAKPLCGIFCYNINLEEKTIYKRFGFEHNKEIDTYIYSGENIDYLHLDFLVSIHSKEDKIKQFFIRYDENNSKYILNRNYPISKHFFSLIKSVT